MEETFSSRQHGDQIADWLESARAQCGNDLELGLELARRAWHAAVDQGYVEEQIEAGRLLTRFHMRRGELTEMLAIGHQLLPLQRTQGASPPLCNLLRMMALGAAELGDFETALACANEGMASARELGDARLISVALNAVGACFERMGDPWQAERLMNEATALLGDQATDYEKMVAQNNLATVALGTYHLLNHSGHERECMEALHRALEHALRARPHAVALALEEPYALALTDGNRGEVLMHLGRLDEAEDLLLSALEMDREFGYVALTWRVRCSLAELGMKRGRLAESLTDLQALLGETQGHDLGGTTAMRMQHAAYRANKALGHKDAALLHLEQVQFLEHRRGVAQLMAQARFFVTRLEAEQGCRSASDAARPSRGREDDELLRDPLTGLGNRRCMESRMPGLMRAAERSEAPLTLALIDVDRFKAINEEHGSAVGDRVLQALAQMLRDNTRGRDLLLRWSGEEILVVLPDTIPDRAFEVCERLRQAVETYRWSELSPGLDVTLSIGLANAPPYATDLLVARAESAMYRAKHLGRNRVALA